MDDGDSSSGMGTLAAFALGRMSARTEQANRNLARSLAQSFQPQMPTVDVDALLAENQALREQLSAAQSALKNYEYNYKRLEEWSDRAAATLRKAGLMKE